MNEMIKFGATQVALSNQKTGMSGSRLMSASEWKRANGLKGAEGKRGYNAYLREGGGPTKALVAAAITAEDVVISGFKSWNSGVFQVTGRVLPKELAVPALADIQAQLAALRAENAALRAARA